MLTEPWMILRCPEIAVYIYIMQKNNGFDEIFPEIKYNSLGKPYLPKGQGFVNWSNSHEKCILAFSKECEVGIDLEFYRERNFKAISKRFFAQSEITDKAEIFYPLWTKKEAYYKCMGGDFFSILKTDSYPNAKTWNLQGPYKEKHELALCVKF
ncbi:MAG: 4'-phosphopantetheinyl transferase superfamily protein [Fibromonadales bacterium]|nr:4'-phosphopantetheinyl transferase superfamily protein [Fibromonadales bacterium]